METSETIFFVLALCLCVYISDCAKINTPRVLLPWFEDTKSNFTFEINAEGCYTWFATSNISLLP